MARHPRSHLRRHELALRDGRREDSMVHQLAIGVVERRQPIDHLVDQDPQRPPVHALAVGHLPQDLGSQVLRRSAERLRRVSLHVLLGETEVGDADVALGVQKEVLRLEVAVHNVVLVEMRDAQHDLSCVEFGTVLGVRELE